MKKIGVILLSGGLDSTTVAALALKQGVELTGITVRYGQKHSREIDSAIQIARILKIKHEVVDISFFKKLAWYSALTNGDSFSIPHKRPTSDMAKNVPITYVPLRNTFFVTLAAALVESQALNLIENNQIAPEQVQASIFIAANSIDYSGYPDCRPEYYRQMSKALFLGSKLGTQYGQTIKLETPIISMTKAEIIKLAFSLKAPLAHTWSCYEGGEAPCGKCDSCLIRAAGFRQAGYPAPSLNGPTKEHDHAKGK
ncbi:MAG TPA: 7-cyano-7-deazaguanine synthase QueC [Dehalococcoidales bacterium]